jgi:hypothetical protein
VRRPKASSPFQKREKVSSIMMALCGRSTIPRIHRPKVRPCFFPGIPCFRETPDFELCVHEKTIHETAALLHLYPVGPSTSEILASFAWRSCFLACIMRCIASIPQAQYQFLEQYSSLRLLTRRSCCRSAHGPSPPTREGEGIAVTRPAGRRCRTRACLDRELASCGANGKRDETGRLERVPYAGMAARQNRVVRRAGVRGGKGESCLGRPRWLAAAPRRASRQGMGRVSFGGGGGTERDGGPKPAARRAQRPPASNFRPERQN